jgi:hypothetical protein
MKMELEEVGLGLDLSGSGWGKVASCCECGNEHSGPIECGVSRLAKKLVASQKGLCSMELDRLFLMPYTLGQLHHDKYKTRRLNKFLCDANIPGGMTPCSL